MIDTIEELKREIKGYQVKHQDQLEEYRLKFISKKGVIGEIFEKFRDFTPDEKRKLGAKINELKQEAQVKFKSLIADLQNQGHEATKSQVDLTLPPVGMPLGSVHPLSSTHRKIIEIFSRIGFNVADGPEIEDDWHNFTALNFPENHPAREMQDTFFIEKDPDIALRTHTSSVQVRLMEKQKPYP